MSDNTISINPNSSSISINPTSSYTQDNIVLKTPNVAEEAISTVVGRQSLYGSPSSNFQKIASLWTTYLKTPITAENVAVMMILIKVSRLTQTPNHRDSIVDIVGYALTLEQVINDRRNNQSL